MPVIFVSEDLKIPTAATLPVLSPPSQPQTFPYPSKQKDVSEVACYYPHVPVSP